MDEYDRESLNRYEKAYQKLGENPPFLIGSKVKVVDKHDRNYRSEGHIVAPIGAGSWDGVEQIHVWVRFRVIAVPYAIHQLKTLKRLDYKLLQDYGLWDTEKAFEINGRSFTVKNWVDFGLNEVISKELGFHAQVYHGIMSGKGVRKHKFLIENAISRFHQEKLMELVR